MLVDGSVSRTIGDDPIFQSITAAANTDRRNLTSGFIVPGASVRRRSCRS